MKALFVSENINFERGSDPKKSLGIGMWMEIEIQEMMERFVEKYEGSYTITRKGPNIEGTYYNEMFNSGGRIIIYNMNDKSFYFTFPGMGRIHKIGMREDWEVDVDSDLSQRVKEIKKLGYNPFLTENVNFERAQDPKKSMKIGIRGRVQEFMAFVSKEMSWNDPNIVFIPEQNAFSYEGLPGNSLIANLRDIVENFGWKNIIKVNKDPDDWGSRLYDDGATRHYYILSFKKNLKESINFERGSDPKHTMGIGRLEFAKKRLGEIANEFGWTEVMVPNREENNKPGRGKSHAKWVNYFGSSINLFSFDREDPVKTLGVYVVGKSKVDRLRNQRSDFDKLDPWFNKDKWISYFNLSESYNFERGQDPKKAIGIGIDNTIFDKWTDFMVEPGVGSVNLDELLNGKWTLVIWVSAFPGAAGKAYEKAQEYFGEYLEDGYNMKSSEISLRIKPEYVRNFIKAYNKRYVDWPITESEDFERGGDIHRAIGVGRKRNIPNYNEGLAEEIMIKLSEDLDNNVNIFYAELEEDLMDLGYDGVDEYLAFGEEREYPIRSIDAGIKKLKWAIEEYVKEFVWNPKVIKSMSKNIFEYLTVPRYDNNKIEEKIDKDLRKNWGITESLDFERGQDPKKAMGIGRRETFPDADLFEEIYDYWKNKVPEQKWPYDFESVEPINWYDKYPNFKVNLIQKKGEDPGYKIFLNKDGVMISYKEFKDAGGGRRREEASWFAIGDFVHFIRILQSNHVMHIPK